MEADIKECFLAQSIRLMLPFRVTRRAKKLSLGKSARIDAFRGTHPQIHPTPSSKKARKSS